ncbi:uncharacterized protein LOC131937309 [Physella acuta]|uniref:uncharacterized protein LOC131937309 n=1 Tax=Physella acuta TaxID=109671 RepID=UPI0027DAD42F|nr:uncharacterized protein LOC131937309 [Physella acuta]
MATRMSSWADGDPLRYTGNTDHWTKMKLRSASRAGQATGDSLNVEQLVADDTLGRTKVQRPTTSPCLQNRSLQNAYNTRAKEGFRYWNIDRPKPTQFGKYGLGSYKMFLGIGSAPRT